MSIVQAIIGTNLTISGGAPPPPPPPLVQGTYTFNGTSTPYYAYGGTSTPTYETNVNFASTNSTGNYHGFLGNSYLLTPAMNGFTTQFYANIWFYPTGGNQIVATLQGTQFENTAYHHTFLEINSSNQPVVGFYPQHPNGGGSGGLVLTDTVNLNTWNHIFLFNNGTVTSACLNGGATETTPAAWLSNSPGAHYVGFGTTSVTAFVASSRFTGRIGDFECSVSPISSNYVSTRAGYQPEIRLAIDAANNPAYTSGDYVLTDAMAYLGYGANGLAIFDQAQDVTQGSLSNVAVGWTVENNDLTLSATVVSRGDFGYPGAMRIEPTSWQPGPYTFKPPADVWRSTNETYRYVTLFNSPTFTAGSPPYYSFDAASLEYGSAQNLGVLARWTVEVWFRVTSSLTGQTMMIIGNAFNGSNLNFSIGTNSSPANYAINTGFFNGAWRTAGSLTPTLNTWYHVVGTYDGNYITQYVNGVQDGQTAYVGLPQSGGEVYIAKRWDNGLPSDHFPGDIGAATIYAGAMTGSEVAKLYQTTNAPYII